jgi:tRNA wybutosine-synthesizing protein 3
MYAYFSSHPSHAMMTETRTFKDKKEHILAQLNMPENEYSDLSPKGSIDEGILDLIDQINQLAGMVTTSSCAGRVSVFIEGKKKASELLSDQPGIAGPGGKGGGRWQFVSHDPVAPNDDLHSVFGLAKVQQQLPGFQPGLSLIHFKFEGMVRGFNQVGGLPDEFEDSPHPNRLHR